MHQQSPDRVLYCFRLGYNCLKCSEFGYEVPGVSGRIFPAQAELDHGLDDLVHDTDNADDTTRIGPLKWAVNINGVLLDAFVGETTTPVVKDEEAQKYQASAAMGRAL